MGFFDKLKNLINKSKEYAEEKRQTPATKQDVSNAQGRTELAANLYEIFVDEYPNYQVRENVAVKEIDLNQEFGGPIDFVLVDGNRVVGAIMLIEKGKKRTKRVHGVELACQNTGVSYANFYIGFNDPKYFPFSREHAVRYLKKHIQ